MSFRARSTKFLNSVNVRIFGGILDIVSETIAQESNVTNII